MREFGIIITIDVLTSLEFPIALKTTKYLKLTRSGFAFEQ